MAGNPVFLSPLAAAYLPHDLEDINQSKVHVVTKWNNIHVNKGRGDERKPPPSAPPIKAKHKQSSSRPREKTLGNDRKLRLSRRDIGEQPRAHLVHLQPTAQAARRARRARRKPCEFATDGLL